MRAYTAQIFMRCNAEYLLVWSDFRYRVFIIVGLTLKFNKSLLLKHFRLYRTMNVRYVIFFQNILAEYYTFRHIEHI